jgi:hypothetical protein
VNSYKEGEDINANNLMADALTKYKARKLTDEWSAPTKEQGQILALTAQVELLSKSAKKPPSKPKPTNKNNDKSNKWAWKDVLPKDGEPTAKEFGGKQYHVNCKHHLNQWVCHTTAECSKNPANAGTPPHGASKSNSTEQMLQGAKITASASNNSGNTDVELDGEDY